MMSIGASIANDGARPPREEGRTEPYGDERDYPLDPRAERMSATQLQDAIRSAAGLDKLRWITNRGVAQASYVLAMALERNASNPRVVQQSAGFEMSRLRAEARASLSGSKGADQLALARAMLISRDGTERTDLDSLRAFSLEVSNMISQRRSGGDR